MTAKFEVGKKYQVGTDRRRGNQVTDYIIIMSRTNKTATIQHCRDNTPQRVKIRNNPDYGEYVWSDEYPLFWARREIA